MERKLYRSRRERMISGVCGGIAEYFEVDPTLARLVAVVLTLVSFGGAAIAYIVMTIVVPEEPVGGIEQRGPSVAQTPVPPPPGTTSRPVSPQSPPTTPPPPVYPPVAGGQPPPRPRRSRGGITFGIVLVVVGLVLLASQFLPGFEVWRLWPLIIVAIGIRTMFRRDDD